VFVNVRKCLGGQGTPTAVPRDRVSPCASTAHQRRSGLGPFSFLTAGSAGFTELPFILLSHASSVLFSVSFVEGSCSILCPVCVFVRERERERELHKTI
jgi:hypothetical protein